MNTPFSANVRIALDKAAQEDVYIHDLCITSKNANDRVHGLIGAVIQQAEARFVKMLDIVPFALREAAYKYVSDKGAEILADPARQMRFEQGMRNQRRMMYDRFERMNKAKAKKKARMIAA